jgi:hypothetical protein
MLHNGLSDIGQPGDVRPAEARRDLVGIQLKTTPKRLRTGAQVIESVGECCENNVRRRCEMMCDLASRIEAGVPSGFGNRAARVQLLVEAEMLFRWAGVVMLRTDIREIRHMGNNFIQGANMMDEILIRSED